MESVNKNLQSINQRIKAAAHRSGRTPDSVKLVAVTKQAPLEKIMAAVECGQHLFGENFVQEANDKINRVSLAAAGKTISWHFIGHLQSNKARQAAELFRIIETVDRLKLARLLNKHLATLGRGISVLVQVNIGREKQKSGIAPEECTEFIGQLRQFEHLEIAGLMAMPPFSADPEMTRPYFKSMRLLATELVDRGVLPGRVELSMGMSGDFEVAIEEGATMVRLGTAVFGART